MGDNAKNSDAPKKPHNEVTLTVTVGDDVRSSRVVFNTPKLLAELKGVDDAAKVKVTADADGESQERVLLEGTKAEAISAIEKSIVPPEKLGVELQKFAQFLLDHSTMKGIGIHAICTDSSGKDAGFGFAITSPDCTMGQAVMLVNCGDANIDEFVSRAKIDVPGRNGTPAKGTVVQPTAEQVKELG